MLRTRAHALRTYSAAALAAALCAACGGSGAGSSSNSAQIAPLELLPVDPAPQPFGLLTTQTIAWIATAAGTYQVTLRPGGDVNLQRVLESATVAAGQVVDVRVSGYELVAGVPSTLTFSVHDSSGNFEESSRTLVLKPVDVLPLGAGFHTDLVYDATRDELLVTDRLSGIVDILNVDPLSSGYGSSVALLPPGPDQGPWYLSTTPDGVQGFNLYRSTMLEYDLQSLDIENNLYLPGGFPPSGIASTPDSTRVYIGYFHTLLTYRAFPPDAEPQVVSTGIVDGLVLGGDIAITSDGRFALYAWFGETDEGLWVVDVDPESSTFHTLLSQTFLSPVPVPDPPSVFDPVTPKVAIAQNGTAAFVGSLSGISKFEVNEPDFARIAVRTDFALSGLETSAAGGADRVLAWEREGRLSVLDDDLRTLGAVQLPELLVDRGAVDEAGGRLFLVSQQQQTSGRVLVVPLR